MRVWLSLANGQAGVEHQDPLRRPLLQIPVRGPLEWDIRVAFQLFVHVLEAGWHLPPHTHALDLDKWQNLYNSCTHICVKYSISTFHHTAFRPSIMTQVYSFAQDTETGVRNGHLNPLENGECQAVRLAWAVIGVLSYDDYRDLVERRHCRHREHAVNGRSVNHQQQ